MTLGLSSRFLGLLLRRWCGCSTKAELENCRRLLHERDVRNSREDGQEVNALRARLAEKEEELAVRVAEHKRAVAKFRKENGSLQHEFEKARSAAKQSRARLAQTENELAIVRKRLQLAQSRPGTPADDGSSRTGRAGLADRAFLFSRTRISVKQEVSAAGSRNRPRSRSPAMGSGRSGRPPSSSARPRSATTVVPLCRDEGLQSLTAVCSAARLVVARRAPQRSFSLSKRLTRNLTQHFFLPFQVGSVATTQRWLRIGAGTPSIQIAVAWASETRGVALIDASYLGGQTPPGGNLST